MEKSRGKSIIFIHRQMLKKKSCNKILMRRNSNINLKPTHIEKLFHPLVLSTYIFYLAKRIRDKVDKTC